MESEDTADWEPAIEEEVKAIANHEVFKFLPEGSVHPPCIIPGKWILGLKLNADGTPLKWKARLVARGDSQVARRDFNDIYSSVVDSTTIRLLLGLAALKDYDIFTLDMPTAFLGCPLAEEIYMCLPDGPWTKADHNERSSPLIRLQKTLYGACQANREWAEGVHDFAMAHDGLNLTASKTSLGLFYGTHGKSPMYLLVYLDDLMLFVPWATISDLSRKLSIHFKVAGPPAFEHIAISGMMITRNCTEQSIRIYKARYIGKVLEHFGMGESSPVITPMDPGSHLQAMTATDTPADVKVYQQAVRPLRYAALGTRPDLDYTVSVLGCLTPNPARCLGW